MKLEIKNSHLILAIFCVFIATLAVGWYIGYKKAKSAYTVIIDTKNKEIEKYVLKLGEDSLYVLKVGQEITNLKNALNKGLLDKETLKALNLKYISEVTRLKGQIKILADSLETGANVIIVRDCDSLTIDTTKAIKLPFSFENPDRKFYQLNGMVDVNGKVNFALTVPMAVDVYTFYDKTAKDYKAVVSSDNPYVQFNGVRSLKMDLQRPKKYNISIFAGYGVTVNKEPTFSPMMGIGVGRSLIRF